MANFINYTKDKVRIANYTTEGGAIVADLNYDGKKDTTRYGMGSQIIKTKEFKRIHKVNSDYY